MAAAAGSGGVPSGAAGGLSTITAAAASVSHIRGVPTSCILIKNAFNPANETAPVRARRTLAPHSLCSHFPLVERSTGTPTSAPR